MGSSHDALDQCLPKDTSGGIAVEEFMALSSTEFRQTTHPPSLSPVPIPDVEERPDSVDPIEAAEVLVPPQADAGVEAGEEEVAVSSSLSDQGTPNLHEDSESGDGEWRLPIRVLNFQRRQFF